MAARRVAVIADVHGNLPALEAVLADVAHAAVEVVVVAGDVAPGPEADAALARLRALEGDVRFVRGNGDREARLDGFEDVVTLAVEGLGRVLVCHGTPRSDEEIVTSLTPEPVMAEVLAGVAADVVVCGHTHVQYDRTVAGVRVVNAGSVGMPYEGRRGAFWALLGPDVELRRTEYDAEAAAARFRDAAPELAEVLQDPPTAREAEEHFEGVAAEQRGG